MNFKPVIAALLALGLVSTPALAAHKAKEQGKKHVHNAHYNGHKLGGNYVAVERYVDTNAARSPVATFDWVNRFHFSGMLNVDAKFSSRAPLGTAPGFRIRQDASDINVNNANLFVDVDVNRWVSAHLGIAYVADSVNLLDWDVNTNFAGTAFSESVRGNKGAVWANSRLGVDEAYITVRDFSQSPFFFRAGKMYVPFGDNPDVYPITYSFTQLLSQTRATAAQAGWVGSRGMYGSVYVLTGTDSSFRLGRRTAIVFDGIGSPEDFDESYTVINNWGAQLGYASAYNCVNYHLSASYIKDIRDGQYLSSVQDLVKYSYSEWDGHKGMGYRFRQVGGLALHGDATYGAFNVTVNYVEALGSLLRDRRHHHDLEVRDEDHHRRHKSDETRIAAGDITGTYTANFCGYNTDFSLGYQRSWDAGPLLPEWRVQGDIGVTVLPYTRLSVQYHYDQSYNRDDRALAKYVDGEDHHARDENEHHRRHNDHRSSNTAALRLGVVF